MGEMREWWANVYQRGSGRYEASAAKFACRGRAEIGACWDIRSRIHVRLKPEGAPRRYASDTEEWLWSTVPERMRDFTPSEYADFLASWTPSPPRTPKIEESAS